MSNQILSRLGPVGHRRGGKAALALALDKADPVNGKDKGKQTPPPVLAYVPRSFDLDVAVMVIGSGLGELKRNPLFPSWCA
jgi:chlorophyllase